MRKKAKKLIVALSTIFVMILLLLTIFGNSGRKDVGSNPAEPVVNVESAGTAMNSEPAGPAEPSKTETVPERQNGERFEKVIIIEGMEETVRYEHVRNDAIGFEIDYDYDRFERRAEPAREYFVSRYDDPGNPENYLEVTYSAEDADTVAASVSESLSNDYDISRDDSFALDRAGRCIRIDASAEKCGLRMPEMLQMVYIVPAADGSRIITAHYTIEGAEGFGRRFRYMADSFLAVAVRGEEGVTEEQALAAVKRYCYSINPDLESIEKTGEYPVYWEIASSDEQEIVVLFRSYTGAQNRYYIDPVSGNTYVTEFVPGITPEEMRTAESFNIRDYMF